MQRSRPTPTAAKSTSCLSHLHTQARTHTSTATLSPGAAMPVYAQPGWAEVLLLLPRLSGARDLSLFLSPGPALPGYKNHRFD